MKFHIVCEGETLKKIAFLYGLNEEELQKENKHIRVWERLIPGTKLKIPTISEAIDQDINSMEPFVEDYYPKLKLDVGNTNPQPEVKVETVDTNEIKQTAQENEVKTFDDNLSSESKSLDKPKVEDIPELKHFQETLASSTTPINIYQYPYLAYYTYPRYVYPQYVYPVYVYPQYLNKR